MLFAPSSSSSHTLQRALRNSTAALFSSKRLTKTTAASCPLPTSPSSFLSLTPSSIPCLYSIGGLYGNPLALKSILEAAIAEETATGLKPTLCFSGDFHFLDHVPMIFEMIHEAVMDHDAMAGNLEQSLLSQGSSCGCDYPEYVRPEVGRRADDITAVLKEVRSCKPE